MLFTYLPYALLFTAAVASPAAIDKKKPKTTKTVKHAKTSTTTTTTTTTKSGKPVKTTTAGPVPTGGSGGGGGGSACTVTTYGGIASAVSKCTNIILKDIHVPTGQSIDLSALKSGTTVTFAGTTTFATTVSKTLNPIIVRGTGVTIQGAPGHIILGNGEVYWDGGGSNTGGDKPNHFVQVTHFENSVIQDLNIKNWPVHCFSISTCTDSIFRRINLDNKDGDAPNSKSGGLPAAHNSDGFDMSNSSGCTITNSTVINQDDCVALTSGDNLLVTDMYCDGGHGISIGSVGGKSRNDISNVLFKDIVVVNSENGPRIKSNSGTTGSITGITYENIFLQNITRYGIDVQQDYLNGGPNNIATNGVKISNLVFKNVTGTVGPHGRNYYILCGDGSCSNFSFPGTRITGGGNASSCNYPASGCPN